MNPGLNATRLSHYPTTTHAATSAACVAFLIFALASIHTSRAAHASLPAKDTTAHYSFQTGALTPLQRRIEAERRRLSSAETEERRDAAERLGAMKRPESSRAAAMALDDRAAIVRATAARAAISLDPQDLATLLAPLLLRDRDEFVRRETAYALGSARNRESVPALVGVLENDKRPSVRGAAAVALGQIDDPSAAAALAASLSRRVPASGIFARITRRKTEEDVFVRRSAAIALGQLKSRDGVPSLIDVLSSERSEDDLRREAALALGLIGDPSALPALRGALAARDPHLSRIAFEALRKLEPSVVRNPSQ